MFRNASYTTLRPRNADGCRPIHPGRSVGTHRCRPAHNPCRRSPAAWGIWGIVDLSTRAGRVRR